jgi:hypothetical protein
MMQDHIPENEEFDLSLNFMLIVVGESELIHDDGSPHLFVNTICCKYSLIELLMMGESCTRNMYSDLQQIIKYCTRVSPCWNRIGIDLSFLHFRTLYRRLSLRNCNLKGGIYCKMCSSQLIY